MLTQSKLKSILHYNQDTGIFINRVNRGPRSRKGDVCKTVNNTTGYMTTRIAGKDYLLHRLAFLYVYGDMPKEQVDHINQIKTDNRWCNLRSVSSATNSLNMGRYKNNTSGYTGVSWAKKKNKWDSRITIDKKVIHLGLYDSKLGAWVARKLAEEFYGFHKNHGS